MYNSNDSSNHPQGRFQQQRTRTQHQQHFYTAKRNDDETSQKHGQAQNAPAHYQNDQRGQSRQGKGREHFHGNGNGNYRKNHRGNNQQYGSKRSGHQYNQAKAQIASANSGRKSPEPTAIKENSKKIESVQVKIEQKPSCEEVKQPKIMQEDKSCTAQTSSSVSDQSSFSSTSSYPSQAQISMNNSSQSHMSDTSQPRLSIADTPQSRMSMSDSCLSNNNTVWMKPLYQTHFNKSDGQIIMLNPSPYQFNEIQQQQMQYQHHVTYTKEYVNANHLQQRNSYGYDYHQYSPPPEGFYCQGAAPNLEFYAPRSYEEIYGTKSAPKELYRPKDQRYGSKESFGSRSPPSEAYGQNMAPKDLYRQNSQRNDQRYGHKDNYGQNSAPKEQNRPNSPRNDRHYGQRDSYGQNSAPKEQNRPNSPRNDPRYIQKDNYNQNWAPKGYSRPNSPRNERHYGSREFYGPRTPPNEVYGPNTAVKVLQRPSPPKNDHVKENNGSNVPKDSTEPSSPKSDYRTQKERKINEALLEYIRQHSPKSEWRQQEECFRLSPEHEMYGTKENPKRILAPLPRNDRRNGQRSPKKEFHSSNSAPKDNSRPNSPKNDRHFDNRQNNRQNGYHRQNSPRKDINNNHRPSSPYRHQRRYAPRTYDRSFENLTYQVKERIGRSFKSNGRHPNKNAAIFQELYHHIGKSNVVKEYTLHLVGSAVTGFGLEGSDLDICLATKEKTLLDPRSEALGVLSQLHKHISNTNATFRNLQLITAKVPILRFKDASNSIEIDLNFNNDVGVRNTHLLSWYAQLDPRVTPLVQIVKLWAKHHSLNDAHAGTINSYSLVLMVIHFLQCGTSPAVLPCLHKMCPEKFNILHDITRIHVSEQANFYWKTENKRSLGELFIRFLDYYANFDYENDAISVRTGGLLPIEECKKVLNGKNDERQWVNMCIEEPFDHTNTARSMYDPNIFKLVKRVFLESCQIMMMTKNLDLLFGDVYYRKGQPYTNLPLYGDFAACLEPSFNKSKRAASNSSIASSTSST